MSSSVTTPSPSSPTLEDSHKEDPREALNYGAVVIPDARYAYSYFGTNNLSTLTNAFLKGGDEPRVLYIVVRRPEDMSVAINVAEAADLKRCFWWPVFLCHTISKGPKRTDLNTPPSENVKGLASHTASCHWQVLCFVDNPHQVEVFKPISHQLITLSMTRQNLSQSSSPSNIDYLTPLLDNIADHLSLRPGSKRAVVISEIDGKPPVLSEYDIIDHDADKNAFVVKSPARKFNLSSARKSRMLKAYLESPKLDVTTLKHDLDALQSHFASQDDYDPNRKIISIVPPRHHEDFITSKAVILAQVQAQIRLLRKRTRMQCKTPGKKRKRVSLSSTSTAAKNKGIGAKTPVTDVLRDFLVDRCGLDPFEANDGIPRTEVVRAIPKYIKKEGLATGRNVQPDEAMRKLLPSPDFDKQLTYFSVFKHINHNFLNDKKKSTTKLDT